VVFSDGMRVRVVAVPDDEPGYAGCVGREGTVEGYPSEWGDATWVYVQLDGDPVSSEFKVEEVEPINVRVVEGVGYVFEDGTVEVGDTRLQDVIRNGKRVRITIEEVPHADSDS
jgi:hypothetical protein